MATIKSYTSLEQSKKLAEILPIESADMHYNVVGDAIIGDYQSGISNARSVAKAYKKNPDEFAKNVIPCWSLAALLDIFPCSKESPIVNLTRGGWNPSFTRRWFATWEDEDKNVFYSCDGISPVDAVVELILKLNEQKLL